MPEEERTIPVQQRSRRRIVAVCAAAVLAVAGLLALVDRPSPSGEQVVAAGTTSTSEPVETTEPTQEPTTSTTSEPTTTTTTAKSPTTTTARRPKPPAPAPTTSTTLRPSSTEAIHPLYGTLGPGTVSVPYTAGQTTWDATTNGIAVRVSIDPPAPRVGDTVTFHVEASAGSLACCGLSILYGDGSRSFWRMQWPNDDCAGAVPGPARFDYGHVYSDPGRWQFAVNLATGHCGDNTYGALVGWLSVGAGPRPTQGPERPSAMIYGVTDATHQGAHPGDFEVRLGGSDLDGYVTRLVVDFGDGSDPLVLPGDPAGCRPAPSGWPQPSSFIVEPNPVHRYGSLGTYTVTLTVVSAGCDGESEQQVRASIERFYG